MAVKKQYRKYIWFLLIIFFAISIAIGGRYYSFGVNTSDSLSQTFFWLQKNKPVCVGDYVAYRKTTALHESETLFVKRVAAVAGDKVTHREGSFYINGLYIGDVEDETRDGEALMPGFQGEIPGSFYFALGEHPLSFDSRYQEMGLIHEDAIIARAMPLY